MAPIIGITTQGRIEKPNPTAHYPEHYIVPVAYVAAVRRAGGVPVLLPPGDDASERWLDLVDGVIVTGGSDVDPTHYGSERGPHIQPPDPERDRTELALTSGVVERDMPALFVCRGMQVLNVALGGTLHGHIPDLGIGDLHRDDTGMWTYHHITATSGSRVFEAMGVSSAKPCSGHHQAVDAVGPGLTVTAMAPDGVVEAIEVVDRSWIVGVQWHPEVSAAEDPTQQALFDRLVTVAG